MTAWAMSAESGLPGEWRRTDLPDACSITGTRTHLEDAVVLPLVVGLVVHGHGDRAAAAAHHAPAVASIGHLAHRQEIVGCHGC